MKTFRQFLDQTVSSFTSRLLPRRLGHLRVIAGMAGLAAVVGLAAGLGAVVFHVLVRFIIHYALDIIVGYRTTGPANESEFLVAFDTLLGGFSPWMLLVVITLGGLASGLIIQSLAPEAKGHGTDAAIRAYHRNNGRVRARVPFVKVIASALTLGTGGSGGREGPIAQIGAGCGSILATRLGLSDYQRRLLLISGMGAGIAAIFRAPLAGAIFAIEVLYREEDFEAEALIPAFIASTVAYCLFGLSMQFVVGLPNGFDPIFAVMPGLTFHDVRLLVPLALMALLMGPASWIYVKFYYGCEHFFDRLRINKYLKAPLGALATGLVAIGIYFALTTLGRAAQNESLSVLAFGYGFLQNVLNGGFQHAPLAAIIVFLLVGLGKMVTTSLTLGSGGSGGVFGPSMVIGGALGGAVGMACQVFWPSIATRIDVFVILGMAAFFSAAAKTPVSTIIIVSEMTSGYGLLLPAMWVAAIAYIVSRGWSIFREQVPSRVDSPAHRGDFIIDVLKGLTIADIPRVDSAPLVTVDQKASYAQILRMIPTTKQVLFPVVDAAGVLLGVFGLNDIRRYLFNPELGQFVIAHDLAIDMPDPLCPDTDLSSAMARFARTSYEELPVVESVQHPKVVAILRRGDVVRMYDDQLTGRKNGAAKTPGPAAG